MPRAWSAVFLLGAFSLALTAGKAAAYQAVEFPPTGPPLNVELDPDKYRYIDLPPGDDARKYVEKYDLRDAVWFTYPPDGATALSFKASDAQWASLRPLLCDGAHGGRNLCGEDICKEYLLPPFAGAGDMAPRSAVPVVLDPSTLEGRVANPKGKPLPGSFVTLMPEDPPVRDFVENTPSDEYVNDPGPLILVDVNPADATFVLPFPFGPADTGTGVSAGPRGQAKAGLPPGRAPGGPGQAGGAPAADPGDGVTGRPPAAAGEGPAGQLAGGPFDGWEIVAGIGWETAYLPIQTIEIQSGPAETVFGAPSPAEGTGTAAGAGTGTGAGAGTGGTQTRTPGGDGPQTATAPPEEPPPSSRPPEEPLPDMVCGPEVTDQVLGTLRQIYDDYQNWDADRRKKHCDTILSFPAALGAWDMDLFSPGMAPQEGDPPDKKAWFQPYASQCAKPRWPCGPTVVFLGQCMHSQVVNYVQWGIMNGLCDQEVSGRFWHSVRDTVMAPWSEGSLSTPHYQEQLLMHDIGAGYEDLAAKGDSPDFIKRVLQRIMNKRVENWTHNEGGWSGRSEEQCAKVCRLTDREKIGFNALDWGYRWDRK